MNVFIFEPSNKFLAKLKVQTIEEVPEALRAFQKSHSSLFRYCYAEAKGHVWTITGISPFEIQEGHAHPPQGYNSEGQLDEFASRVKTDPEALDAEIFLLGTQGKLLLVNGDIIRIKKQSLLTGKREKTIPIHSISSVEVKEPGDIWAGFIQFSIAGGVARDSSFSWTGGAFSAAADENSVLFTGQDNYKIALKVKSYVEAWATQKQGHNSIPPETKSIADEIRKFKNLMDEGILTLEEFEAKKKQLLSM